MNGDLVFFLLFLCRCDGAMFLLHFLLDQQNVVANQWYNFLSAA